MNYKPGDKVVHSTFGSGVVLETNERKTWSTITIKFKLAGKRKLLVDAMGERLQKEGE